MKLDDKINQRHPGKPSQIGQNVLLACLAMASGMTAAPAFAQSANTAAPALEEVIVSARKRNEQLLEVPISIIAVSEKEIRAAGVADLYDVAATSGFTFNQYSSSAAGRTLGQITFRGLQSHTALSSDASGSLFVDGIFISGGQASIPTTDVARIEVLKGPQNAFFGRSTFGGAINYVTKNPSDKFQGEINASVNNASSTDMDATVEGPLKEGVLKGRLVVYSHNKTAPWHASDGGDIGAEKTHSVTGTLVLTPTKNSWLRFRASSQRDDDSAPSMIFLSATKFGDTSCTGRTYSGFDINHNPISYSLGVPYFCNGIPSFDSKYIDYNTTLPSQFSSVWQQNSLNVPFFNDVPRISHMGTIRETTRLSLQGGMDLPNNWEFVFNIGYNKMASMSAFDLDRTTTNNFFDLVALANKDLTIDARLQSDKNQRIRGLIGASRYHGTEHIAQADWYGFIGAKTMTPPGNYLNNESTVPAIYGSIEADVTNELTLTAEARQQTDKIVGNSLNDIYAPVTSEKKNLLPRLTAKYKFNPSSSVYASFAEGVQPLAVNSGFVSATAVQRAYLQGIIAGANEFAKQPKVKTFEIGIKQRVLNNQVQYSAAYYDQKWKDAETLTSVWNDPATCTGIFNTPACPLGASGASVWLPNDAHIRGIEFAGDAIITPVWTVSGTMDYKDAKWDKFYYANNSSLTNPAVFNKNAFYFDGARLRGVPKWQWTLSSTYRMPSLIKGYDGYVRGDVVYMGEAPDTEPNINMVPAYTRANLRFGLEKKDMTIELFVKNVFNDHHWNFAVRNADTGLTPYNQAAMGVSVGPADPRTVGIRTNIKF